MNAELGLIGNACKLINLQYKIVIPKFITTYISLDILVCYIERIKFIECNYF